MSKNVHEKQNSLFHHHTKPIVSEYFIIVKKNWTLY